MIKKDFNCGKKGKYAKELDKMSMCFVGASVLAMVVFPTAGLNQ